MTKGWGSTLAGTRAAGGRHGLSSLAFSRSNDTHNPFPGIGPRRPGTDAPEWHARRDLPCRTGEHPATLWDGEVAADTSRARALCRGCPMRQACFDDAQAYQPSAGVWGGYTSHEIERLRRGDHVPVPVELLGPDAIARCGHRNELRRRDATGRVRCRGCAADREARRVAELVDELGDALVGDCEP